MTAGAPKSANNVTSTSFNIYTAIHLLPKDLRFELGCQTCFLPRAASNVVTPLCLIVCAVSFAMQLFTAFWCTEF